MDADFRLDAEEVWDVANTYPYTDRHYEAGIGLFYHCNRYYDAKLDRFCSRDPIGYFGSEWNLDECTSGNPVLRMDPFGLDWLASLVDLIDPYNRYEDFITGRPSTRPTREDRTRQHRTRNRNNRCPEREPEPGEEVCEGNTWTDDNSLGEWLFHGGLP